MIFLTYERIDKKGVSLMDMQTMQRLNHTLGKWVLGFVLAAIYLLVLFLVPIYQWFFIWTPGFVVLCIIGLFVYSTWYLRRNKVQVQTQGVQHTAPSSMTPDLLAIPSASPEWVYEDEREPITAYQPAIVIEGDVLEEVPVHHTSQN